MAMTPQEARVIALRMRAQKPELQNMPMDNLIAKIMMAEGNPDPGATVMTPGGSSRESAFDGLSNIFPAQLVTPASPAPVRPGVNLEAPKPTAQMVPAVGGPLERKLPDQVRQAAAPTPAPAPTPEAPLSDEPVTAPKKAFQSRFKPQLESTMYELQQLDMLQKAAVEEEREVPPEVAEKISVLSDRANRLKALVAAEEGAIVDADRAALLERQTKRLSREEELIEQARKRAPGEALMKFGTALASAAPGESFASALARGLQAGSESYSGARESREQARRRIDERRDAFTLQNIDALQKARDDAIRLDEAGYTLDKQGLEMKNLTNQSIINRSTRAATIEAAIAQASEAKTKAEYAPQREQAGIRKEIAAAKYYESGGSGGPSGADKPLTQNQRLTKITQLNRERRAAMVELNTPGVVGAQKKALQEAIAAIDVELSILSGAQNPFLPTAGKPPAASAPFRWDPKAGVVPNK